MTITLGCGLAIIKNNLKILRRFFTVILIFLFSSATTFSQDQRLNDNNTIAWVAYTGLFKLNNKLGIHTEYQWRRVDGFKNWQQSLIRTGINYRLRSEVSLNAGYAFAETFSYGDYPGSLFAFPEHRIFEQIVINNSIGKIEMSNRFTLEQRFLGKVQLIENNKVTQYSFLNRMRYRLRSEIPIKNDSKTSKGWSIIFQDEIFIGWGKELGANVFDQNRLSLLLGYRLNQSIKFEAGYINQILQQGKRINDKSVLQYNNGLIISMNITVNTQKN